MATESKLLQGGLVLTHGADDHVLPIKADLLIEGNVITKIEDGIQPSAEYEVIDCTDKILSPGFIDTHHHVWQTLLKGRHADHLLLDYLAPDVYWGQLGGCLECLDVGTTTVVDHAHVNYSPDHGKYSSVYCYCPTPTLESWAPFSLTSNLLPDWVISTLEALAAKAPFGNGRVVLGFAFDGFFLPKEVIVPLFQKVKSLGIKTWTAHYGQNAAQGSSSLPELLDGYGLLDSSVLLSHAGGATPEDAALLRKTNSHISTTPSTELQMGIGDPILNPFRSDIDILSQCSLGVDCSSNNSASMVSEMRLLLQSARGAHNAKFLGKGVLPNNIYHTVEEAFNLGTISGARAVDMQDKIGSLAVGKLADIVIFDALSSSMVCGAQHDPVAAIVLHSSPADIEMVIVDGVIRKRHWMLENVDVKLGREVWDGEKRDVLAWKDIARELVERRKGIQQQIEKIDMGAAKEDVIKSFYIDKRRLVDTI
ncbi:5 -deoxyadenosine deaminase [Hyphodiscus hymeniophilus]|uniref:5 -deoxyadenosine deaminase n=1 Tax=Hyphodiscus hymeniophilus TaxID=353542 RepID=A0A9P6VPJ7_9HELO|nr:5 -deoxyadenosine deaminase [Hyphodiscus hymeniophilus]